MNENPFIRTLKPKQNRLVQFLAIIAVITTVAVILYLVAFPGNEVHGPSMNPNFNDGEFVITSKIHHWATGSNIGRVLNLSYKENDVIVF